MAKRDEVTIYNSRIMFPNFSGHKGKYNREGERSFLATLDPGTAEAMSRDGWNVRFVEPRDEGDEPLATLRVKVNMDGAYPPRVYLITSSSRTLLDAETIGILDTADLENADLVVNPYRWALADGSEGITAYLSELFVTIRETELERKYGIYKGVGTDD